MSLELLEIIEQNLIKETTDSKLSGEEKARQIMAIREVFTNHRKAVSEVNKIEKEKEKCIVK